MFNRRSKLVPQVADLPHEGQEQLFGEAFGNNKADALEIILEAADIKPESLRRAFYSAATHDKQEMARLLVANPNTDVNWPNKDNYGLTSAMRAAMNDHGEIVEMILDREDFDPNVIVEITDYLGVPYEKTVVAQVFGYKPKDSIETPDENWKRRLLNDTRVDWGLHAELIIKAQETSKISKQKSAELDQWSANREALEEQVSPVRQALGLSTPVCGG